MTDVQNHPAPGADPTRPSAARVWDYLLGGKDNYAIDRAAAEMIMNVAPDVGSTALASRAFLVRAVRFLAQAGIRQFIDLGTGLPTSPNVHEVAREAQPDARVAYVDYDPLVVVHSQALLDGVEGVRSVQGDIRKPEEILDNPKLHEVIDLAKPVAVLFVAVLPFVTDEQDPAAIVARFRERMVLGSHLAIVHASTNSDPEAMAQAERAFANTPNRPVPRSREAILRYFDGFDLVEPGLVRMEHWRPDIQGVPATKLTAEAGVALLSG